MKYLYIPFSQNTIRSHPEIHQKINSWTQLLKNNGKQVTICYQGDGNLTNIDSKDSIYVFAYGSKKEINGFSLSNTSPLDRGLLSEFEVGFYVKDEKFIAKTQNDIVKNLLSDLKTSLTEGKKFKIKLFYLNAGKKINELVRIFHALVHKGIQDNKTTGFRVDYYNNLQLPATSEKQGQGKQPRFSQFKQSLFTPYEFSPQIDEQKAKEITQSYYKYKSARLCGLSGFLHLNRFFSSAASLGMVAHLEKMGSLDKELTPRQKHSLFLQIKQHAKKYPHGYLSTLLENAAKENAESCDRQYWKQSNKQL